MKLAVLVVDDNQDACAMMAKLLRAFGYEVDTANDGPSALQLIERKRYGIAIIDYQMPGMNGVDLFRRIRVARPDLAGVFLTGHTTINVVSPAIEAGVLRVLAKPVDFEELIPIIEDHIGTAA
jgi:CheY-like chemotaxis protein